MLSSDGVRLWEARETTTFHACQKQLKMGFNINQFTTNIYSMQIVLAKLFYAISLETFFFLQSG